MTDLFKEDERSKFTGILRDLKTEDLEQIRPILEDWIRWQGEVLTEEVESTLKTMRESAQGENKRNYFVAIENGQVLGMIGFAPPDKRMLKFAVTDNPVEGVNIFVSKDHARGRGIGLALVKKAEEEALAKGYKEFIFNSGPRYKDSGWGFHDQLPGFARVGIAEKYYDDEWDAPVWGKVL